jgi:regulator of sirC expression with transglutaminase-like and TPR domain
MSADPAGPSNRGEDPQRAAQQQAQVAAARRRFTALARGPEEAIDLAEACLLIAAEEYPGLDVPAYLARIEDLAERVRITARTAAVAESVNSDETALRALHHVLFEQERFEGDPIEEQFHPYYHPRNSFLNEVLDRRRGMPITLSVLYCEVARRAGFQAAGIGLPGHFIAEFRGEHFSALVDPYSRGRRLSPEERAQLPAEFLQPAAKKQVLARVLTNLKQAYRLRGPMPKALSAVERLLVLNPSLDQVRDRGLILAQMNLPGPAWFDLKLYARLAQGAPDAGATAEAADKLWRLMGRLN